MEAQNSVAVAGQRRACGISHGALRPKQGLLALILLASAFAGANPLQAGDWYVDALTGNNANDGLTPQTAWRTITHAVATVPGNPETVHVAPGVYDSLLGESFPLQPHEGIRIVGTQGSAHTILDGGGAGLLGYSTGVEWPWITGPISEISGVDGLTLRNGSGGIDVSAFTPYMEWELNQANPSFSDIVIESMSGAAVSVSSGQSFWPVGSGAGARFTGLVIRDCDRGIVASGGYYGGVGVTLVNGEIRSCTREGVVLTAGAYSSASVQMQGFRIIDNGGHGVVSASIPQYPSFAQLNARACLFSRNQGCGISGNGGFDILDCTIAHNAEAGLRSTWSNAVNLNNSVVAGNADDLDLYQPCYANWSNSADGDLLGQPGCIAADPLFVDPAGGDYRLRWGSPCLEIGDPDATGRVDLLGHVRPYDGDLDTLAGSDMGSFEFEPLHIDGEARPGQMLRFEQWGAPGAQSSLLLMRRPLQRPQLTTFGVSYLAPSRTQLLATVTLPALLPYTMTRSLPNDPALIGWTYSFQSLTSSSSAPAGWALSNPISFVIGP